jgi:lipid-A-disaccharide synthase
VDVRFVGHPLTDVVQSPYDQSEARKQLGLDPVKRTVAFLPGSRTKEIANHLPEMLKAASILKARYEDLQFVLPTASTLSPDFIRTFIKQSTAPVTIIDGRVYDVLRASDAAVVTSGTATLEAGLMAVPMVIIYRFSTLSYVIARMLLDIEHIGLVNIVAGKRVVPELVQHEASSENIANAVIKILDDREYYRQMRAQLAGIRAQLGEGGASARAASVVREFLKGNDQV